MLERRASIVVVVGLPWVLWPQHDRYGVAAHVERSPRADEKVWMSEARIVPR